MDKIQNLVRRAMGYSAERGDTVSVVNSPFSAAAQDQLPPWKDPYYIGLAMQIGRYLLIFLAIMLIWRSVLKPLVQNLTAPRSEEHTSELQSLTHITYAVFSF